MVQTGCSSLSRDAALIEHQKPNRTTGSKARPSMHCGGNQVSCKQSCISWRYTVVYSKSTEVYKLYEISLILYTFCILPGSRSFLRWSELHGNPRLYDTLYIIRPLKSENSVDWVVTTSYSKPSTVDKRDILGGFINYRGLYIS